MRDSKDNRSTHQRANRKSRFFSSESNTQESKKKGFQRPPPAGRFVPVHLRTCKYHPTTKLVSDYYPWPLDLLIIKCPQKFCEYHEDSTEIIENFRANKAKQRRYWEEQNKPVLPESTPAEQ